jgi:hypothetical protein
MYPPHVTRFTIKGPYMKNILGAGQQAARPAPGEMQMQEKTIQVNAPCIKCGSYYRRGLRICSICGTDNEPSGPCESNPFKGLSAVRKKMHDKKKYRY